jgi:hypothetical protein
MQALPGILPHKRLSIFRNLSCEFAAKLMQFFPGILPQVYPVLFLQILPEILPQNLLS